ncbi:PAS domain-containing sensor histidine kinase [Shouchella patagoniensis]|uniref:PAS domain-containing sensor histidine kinase n=1 Tax=Shouchella patagoniensis TaxID=228576 RepID=UPI00099554B1|nr:PAS domain-containing sensor histidine kinase [Shouchella patagoniensis]
MKSKKKVLLLYVGISVFWIVGTDIGLSSWEPELYTLFQKVKGIIFVAATGIFIYFLMRKSEKIQTLREEKEKVGTLINSMVDFVNFKDGEGRWIQANEFGLKLYQLEGVAYEGKKDSELAEYSKFYRDALLYCEKTDEETWQNGEMTRAEEVFTLPNGEEKIFDTIKTPLFRENGERKGLVVIGRDITERIKAEKKLAESELRYKALFEHNPELVYMIDLNGTIVDLNDQFEYVTGYKRNDAIGKPFISFIREEDHLRLHKKFSRVINERRAHQCNEVHVNHRTGKKVIVNCASVPIIIEDEIVGITGYANNITKMIETEEKLRTTEKLAVIGELAAGIAHEIRNPLTSLHGFVQLFQTESEKENPLHRIMLDELERINMIASELLVLSRPQEIAFSRTNVRSVLKDIVRLLNSEAHLHGSSIRLNTDEDLFVRGDANQLKQLFINIIKNATEAGATIIEVDSKPIDDYVCITVQDNGCGISSDRIEKLGEPFYSRKEKGTGLGLTISHKIVEAHLGKIHYDSKLDVGTTVFISIPLYEE